MTDERLLEQAASGDETAFAVIYERHRGLVFRFAYRLSQSREMAEEITHDCFLSLIKEPRRFKTREQRASLRTYLCAAARNLAFKRLRRAGAESQETENHNQAPAGRRRRQSPQVPLWSAGAAKMAEEIRFHRDAPAELP